MKRIAIKVPGSEAEPLDIILQEGVTVREVLKATGLTGHIISLSGSHVFLAPEEVLYDKINDGDKLYACMPACEVY